MAYDYTTGAAQVGGLFNWNLLFDVRSFYDPVNLNVAIATSLLLATIAAILINALLKPSREEWKTSVWATFWFVLVDYAIHIAVPSLVVPMPLYSIEKAAFTFLALVVLLRYLKNLHVISAIIVLALEYRYYLLYPGRTFLGLNFDLALVVIHYLILFYSLEYAVNDKKPWEVGLPWNKY